MRLLVRVIFWLGLVALLLPATSLQYSAPTPGVSAGEAVSAATAAVGDLSHFCARQPDACTIGSQALSQLRLEAEAGAKRLYRLLHDGVGSEQGKSGGGGLNQMRTLPSATSSQHTLTPADVAPAWRGLSPRRELNSNKHRA